MSRPEIPRSPEEADALHVEDAKLIFEQVMKEKTELEAQAEILKEKIRACNVILGWIFIRRTLGLNEKSEDKK